MANPAAKNRFFHFRHAVRCTVGGLHLSILQRLNCRVRRSKNFPDRWIFRTKNFRLGGINCDIVKFLTKVYKKAVLMAIRLKELICKIYIYKERHILWMIWIVSRSLEYFLNHPDTVQTIWHLNTFQIIKTLTDYLDTFGSSENLSDHPDTLHIIQKLFRPSGHFQIL